MTCLSLSDPLSKQKKQKFCSTMFKFNRAVSSGRFSWYSQDNTYQGKLFMKSSYLFIVLKIKKNVPLKSV